MVDRRVRDGTRIARLLASEVEGLAHREFGSLSVADADRDAEPSDAGTFAYAIERDGERIGTVALHPERVRLDLRPDAGDAAAAVEAADDAGLATRTGDDGPTVFVADGAEVKRALDVLAAFVAGDSGG